MTRHSLAVRSFAALSLLALAPCILAQSPPPPAGFGTGLRGFERLHEPLGQPIYFESALVDTSARALFLRHEFSDRSTLQGGDVTIYAVQARLALSERLALIATKDGYSILDAGIVEDEGWNDLAAGLKYAAHVDRAAQLVVTPGIRYMAENGHRGILQGGCDELSPFVSVAKGFGDTHVLGNVTLRVPLDGDEGNTVGHWDVHVDHDLNPGDRAVVAPLLEVHGVHYLDDGASPLNVGGLDYTNLGSQPAERFVAWFGVGLRVELDHRYELGACYEMALTDPDDDLMDRRVTVDFAIRW